MRTGDAGQRLAREDEQLCERCGYSLEGLEQAAREVLCPECGKPLAESHPDRRDGGPSRTGASWVAGAWALLTAPGATYERVMIDTLESNRFRRKTTARLAWVLMAIAIGVTGLLPMLEPGLKRPADYLAWLSLVVPGVYFFWVVTFVLTRIERFGLGILGRAHRYRVTPAVAKVVTDYASIGWLIGSVLILLGVLASFATPLYGGVGRVPPPPLRLDATMWYPLAGFLIGLLIFETLAYIGVRRCRFANTPRARVRAAQPSEGGSAAPPGT